MNLMIEIHQITVILIAAFSLIVGIIAGVNIRLLRKSKSQPIKASDIIDPYVKFEFSRLNKELQRSTELMKKAKEEMVNRFEICDHEWEEIGSKKDGIYHIVCKKCKSEPWQVGVDPKHLFKEESEK